MGLPVLTIGLAALMISLAAGIAFAGLFQFHGARRDALRFPPPGRLIDVGGRQLHARVEGKGPVVVFEAGISASSLNWILVQPPTAKFATTCSYDRAGLGWSDAPGCVFDAERMVSDLAVLLEKLNLPAPYVLVGHSFGGLLIRLYAERYPAKVAGLVLVDPVLECVWGQPDLEHQRIRARGVRVARLFALLTRLGVTRAATSPKVVRSVIVPKFGGHGPGHLETADGVVDRLQTELRKLPPETVPVIRAHWCKPKTFSAMVDHLNALEGAFHALQKRRVEYPVIVLSGNNTAPEGIAEHRAIAALSSKGEHLMAPRSGHWIQFDEPELIVEAVRRVLSSALSTGVLPYEP